MASSVHKLLQFCGIGGFCILVELHRASGLQPVRQACFEEDLNILLRQYLMCLKSSRYFYISQLVILVV